MTNALHPPKQHALTSHYDSMMASLAHRLDVARRSNNAPLIQLLEKEKQFVADTAAENAPRSRGHWFKSLTQAVTEAFFGRAELQVYEMVDGRDRWWVATDSTGQCVYADSEAELRLWIKENYQGK